MNTVIASCLKGDYDLVKCDASYYITFNNKRIDLEPYLCEFVNNQLNPIRSYIQWNCDESGVVIGWYFDKNDDDNISCDIFSNALKYLDEQQY